MPFDCFLEDTVKGAVLTVDERDEMEVIAALKAEHGTFARVDWDAEKKAVVVGKMEMNRYRQFKDIGKFISAMFSAHDITYSHWNPKWKAKAFTAVFGMSPSKLHSHMNKLMYKKFVVPYKDILTKVNFQRGRISVSALENITRNEALCREVYSDGLYNLLPIVANTGLHPSELKKSLGPVWKVLINNSLHKNRILMKLSPQNRRGKLDSSQLAARATLPTTVLDKCSHVSIEAMQHVAAHYKGKWGKLGDRSHLFGGATKELRDIGMLVNDTIRLSDQLDMPFNALWSPRKMKEKHDQYSKELNARRYSPAKIEWLKALPVREFEYEGYVAKLLDSRALIAEEGSAMGHCVAGYAESVASGDYLVYSVTKDGCRSSTLGINVSKWKKSLESDNPSDCNLVFRVNQHYGKYNARLIDKSEIEIGEMIVKRLNTKSVN